MQSLRHKSGFTLIELMVAISIVAILSMVAIITFAGALKNNRDQQRIKGLTIYQQALELYRHDRGKYPDPTGFPVNLDPNYLTINSEPKDPLGVTPYPYYTCGDASCTNYCLYTVLENAPASPPLPCPTVIPYNYSMSSP